MRSWFSLLAAAALLLAPSAGAQPAPAASPTPEQKEKPAKKPKPELTDAEKAARDEERENAVLESLPAGETYTGLRIPNFSPTGKLLMLFAAKSARRAGDREIEMTDLNIEINNDDGTSFRVQMAHSVFNLDTRILTSDTPTKISRDDFTIEGARAEFHTKTRFGRMLGPTTMVIKSENAQ